MIIATLDRINRNEVGMILSKYNISSLNLSQYAITSRIIKFDYYDTDIEDVHSTRPWNITDLTRLGNILLMLHVTVEKFLFCKPSLYIVFPF